MNPRHTINAKHEPTCDELNAAMRQQQRDTARMYGNLPSWRDLRKAYPTLDVEVKE